MPTAKNRPKPPKKKKPTKRYSPELLYQYWSVAGGNVLHAIRLAEQAGEERVPARNKTWADYAEKHSFAERLEEETKERWEQYHAERLEKEQRILDTLAHAFEVVAEWFTSDILSDIEAMKSSNEKEAAEAEARLRMFTGSIAAFDRFFRMYLRALGQPEKITQQDVREDKQNIVTYAELEDDDEEWDETEKEMQRLSQYPVTV
jgi:hypothetical protein